MRMIEEANAGTRWAMHLKYATAPGARGMQSVRNNGCGDVKFLTDRGSRTTCCCSVIFGELVRSSIPHKLGVLQVMKLTGNRSATWQNQVLVLYRNMLATFPAEPANSNELENALRGGTADMEALLVRMRGVRSEVVFDLSEPTLTVSVSLTVSGSLEQPLGLHSRFSQSPIPSRPENAFEWTLSVQRVKGIALVRFRCARIEERDAWVSALRSGKVRNPLWPLDATANDARSSLEGNPCSGETHRMTATATPVLGMICREGSLHVCTNKKNSNSRGLSKRKSASKSSKQLIVPSPNQVDSNSDGSFKSCSSDFGYPLNNDTFVVFNDDQGIDERQIALANELIVKAAKQGEQFIISRDEALVLLMDHAWCVEAAFTRLSQATSLLTLSDAENDKNQEENEDGSCMVCFDPLGTSDQALLMCGHRFCVGCWRGYLTSAIEENGPGCLRISCMASECGERVPPGVFRKILNRDSDEGIIKRFERLRTNAFVDGAEKIRWCPDRGCNRAVEWTNDTAKMNNFSMCGFTIQCECSARFCFQCARPAHAPATCDQVAAWGRALLKAEEASGVEAAPTEQQEAVLAKQWMLRNSRPCPKCKVPIQKTSGCNHIACSSCGHEFCWVCFKDWEKHSSQTGGFYRCTMFGNNTDKLREAHLAAHRVMQDEVAMLNECAVQEKTEHAEQAAKHAKAQLMRKRVEYFSSQFQVHEESGRFAKNLLQKVEERVLANAAAGAATVSEEHVVALLRRAITLVLRCQEMLQWSYVILFFLDSPKVTGEWLIRLPGSNANYEGEPEPSLVHGPHRALFLVKLGKLELAVERLQDAIHAPAVTMHLWKLRGDKQLGCSGFMPSWKNMFNFMKSKSRKTRMEQDKPIATTATAAAAAAAADVSMVASFEQDICALSSGVVSCAFDLARFSTELHTQFFQLAHPGGEALTKLCDRSGTTRNNKLGEQVVSIVPVRKLESWACHFCRWGNIGNGTFCTACNTTRASNIFVASRLALVQQVRNCTACSADLRLPETFAAACACSGNNRSRLLATNGSSYRGSLCHAAVEETVFTCPECTRDVFKVPKRRHAVFSSVVNDSHDLGSSREYEGDDIATELLLAKKERIIHAALSEGRIVCGEGHVLQFLRPLESSARECDCCNAPLHEKTDNDTEVCADVGFCAECNWFVCYHCAHLHCELVRCKLNHSILTTNRRCRINRRKRRNAVYLQDADALQNMRDSDIVLSPTNPSGRHIMMRYHGSAPSVLTPHEGEDLDGFSAHFGSGFIVRDGNDSSANDTCTNNNSANNNGNYDAPVAPSVVLQDQQQGWMCGSCTFFNHNTTSRCVMCLHYKFERTVNNLPFDAPEQLSSPQFTELPSPIAVAGQASTQLLSPPLHPVVDSHDVITRTSEELRMDMLDHDDENARNASNRSIDSTEGLENALLEAMQGTDTSFASLDSSTSSSLFESKTTRDWWAFTENGGIGGGAITVDAFTGPESDNISAILPAAARAYKSTELAKSIESMNTEFAQSNATPAAVTQHRRSVMNRTTSAPASPFSRQGDDVRISGGVFKGNLNKFVSASTSLLYISSCSRETFCPEVHAKKEDDLGCLVLIKPVRRDPKRATILDLGDIGGIMEIFWETSGGKAAPFITVTVCAYHASNQESNEEQALTMTLANLEVENSGICYVKLPPATLLREALEQGSGDLSPAGPKQGAPGAVRLWVELRLSSDSGPQVSTPVFSFV